MKQPLFTINSTFSEEEVVRFNKYVILHTKVSQVNKYQLACL